MSKLQIDQEVIFPKLRELAALLAEKSAVPFEHALHEIVAISSFCASGTHKVVHPLSGKSLFLNNYYILVAESGSGKSTVRNELLEEWNKTQCSLYSDYKRQKENYEVDFQEYKKESKKGNKTLIEPTKPIMPLLFLADITKEALMKLLSANEVPILATWLTEGALFFNSMGMSSDNKIKMLALLNSLWSNEGTNSITIKEGIYVVSGEIPFSMNIAVQENVFINSVATLDNEDIGFSSRLLVCRPKYIPNRQFKDNINDYFFLLDNFKVKIARWLENEILCSFQQGKKVDYKELKLTSKATDYYSTVIQTLRSEMEEGGLFEYVRPFVSKADVHILRLAGAVKWAHDLSSDIDYEDIQCAYELFRWYLVSHMEFMEPEKNKINKEKNIKAKFLRWTEDKKGKKILFKVMQQTILQKVSSAEQNALLEELSEQDVIEDMRNKGIAAEIDGVKSKKWIYICTEKDKKGWGIDEKEDWCDE